MAAATLCWHCYRERVLNRVRRQCSKSGGFGKTLIFHSPDSAPCREEHLDIEITGYKLIY